MTDIETDGPAPGPNSMIAFASVAVTAAGRQIDEFEAVLEPLPHAQPDPGTSAWWATQPLEVQEAARTNPRAIDDARGYANLFARVVQESQKRRESGSSMPRSAS